MKRTLLSKNKIKFVNGKIPRPNKDDNLFDAWEQCNKIVLAWISDSLSPDTAQSAIYVENVAQLWTDLHNQFSKGDHFYLFGLLQQIHSMKQDDKSIASYFNELNNLWEDLDALRILPNCTCGAHDARKKQIDFEYVICFLKMLNDNFNHVKSQILMMEPRPDVTKVFSSILQQERQLAPLFDYSKILMAHAHNYSPHAKFQSKQSRGSRKPYIQSKSFSNSKVCSFYGKTGYTLDTCYFKHGFPPSFRFKDKEQPSLKMIGLTKL
ncbi:uncharacterized protein LOC127094629 [Lathyrus oleraceus]|uniref:uncharacterized protein LOC127094629 n=1 Tax=Pisum sativum TaxID=3888 RepID=UPI0021D3141D|nr:uncharacterized protein LOC127094629 [Pisum sativum]